jgi:hypothetical protein
MPKKKRPSQSSTNGWDAFINVTNKFYNLANSGNIIGLVVLGALGLIGLFMHRMPEDQLGPIAHSLLAFFSFEKFYLFPLVIVLGLSLIGNARQHRIYRKEIAHLAKEKKALILGIEQGELKILSKLASSKFDINKNE